MAQAMGLPCPVVALELPSYQRKENWGAAETFYQLVRKLADKNVQPTARETRRPRANILGPTALGFRHRDDVIEITRLLGTLGVVVNVTAPMGAAPADLEQLGNADFNICLYPEIADTTCRWLDKTFGQKTVRTVPIGHAATRDFIAEVAALAGVDASAALDTSNLPWWSKSVDSTYLTGKRVFIFGDATHAVAAARVARDELGFEVVGLGCYNREFARDVRDAAKLYGVEPLITDDYLEVEDAIQALQPELVPRHADGAPHRQAPAHPLRGDFGACSRPRFSGALLAANGVRRRERVVRHLGPPIGHGAGGTSADDVPRRFRVFGRERRKHLGHGSSPKAPHTPEAVEAEVAVTELVTGWSSDAEKELLKIPFFVRGKARRNTEKYAAEQGLAAITLDTLYDAKAHYAR